MQVPIRLREVTYTLSPFQQSVMNGLWKDLPHKAAHYASTVRRRARRAAVGSAALDGSCGARPGQGQREGRGPARPPVCPPFECRGADTQQLRLMAALSAVPGRRALCAAAAVRHREVSVWTGKWRWRAVQSCRVGAVSRTTHPDADPHAWLACRYCSNYKEAEKQHHRY